MKAILVPTDFSPPAQNACGYALRMAKVIAADIVLANAITVVKEPPITFQSSLPVENIPLLRHEVLDQLDFTAARMRDDIDVNEDVYIPVIETTVETGSLTGMIASLKTKINISLIVMGAYGSPALSRLLLGCNSLEILGKSFCPVLLVPFTPFSNEVNKIAFASDLRERDLFAICSMIELLRPYQADVMITHVVDKNSNNIINEHRSALFLAHVKKRTDYSHVFYRQITNSSVDVGLEDLCRHGSIDLLAMVHSRRSSLLKVFTGDHAKEMAKHMVIPLIVFPAVGEA